jgi:hypothetical protein
LKGKISSLDWVNLRRLLDSTSCISGLMVQIVVISSRGLENIIWFQTDLKMVVHVGRKDKWGSLFLHKASSACALSHCKPFNTSDWLAITVRGKGGHCRRIKIVWFGFLTCQYLSFLKLHCCTDASDTYLPFTTPSYFVATIVLLSMYVMHWLWPYQASSL